MFIDFIQKPHKRPIIDLNIVPILDMLTTVIFFLLLSISFIELTKLTLPPSTTVSVENPSEKRPLAPKLILTLVEGGTLNNLQVVLSWTGDRPGERTESFSVNNERDRRLGIVKFTSLMTQSFKKDHPEERTLRLALNRRLPYQDLVSAMDGSRDAFPDTVLISYVEAQSNSTDLPVSDKSD